MITDFSERSSRDELMDTEVVSFDEFRACLRDLARVNRLTFAYRPTLAFFERLLRVHGPALRTRTLRVLDVGSGYGDMLREVAAWAKRRGVAVSLVGVDLNPHARLAASEVASDGPPIEWVTDDAFAYRPDVEVDVVLSSLFTHHLPDPLVTRFLGWMEQRAKLGWFVNDLYRHPVPYHLFRTISRWIGFHRFVLHDGPVSIARAFVPADWSRLLASAGLSNTPVDVEPTFPFRLTVARVKTP